MPGKAEAMTPTEELFHLGPDRLEMTNVASDSTYETQLAAARAVYDAEMAALKASVFQGHGYEPYPVLFNRTTAWADKAPLLMGMKKSGDSGEGNSNKENKKKRKRKQKHGECERSV